jgi:hypothetical protein
LSLMNIPQGHGKSSQTLKALGTTSLASSRVAFVDHDLGWR